jgi:hypothetical protein
VKSFFEPSVSRIVLSLRRFIKTTRTNIASRGIQQTTLPLLLAGEYVLSSFLVDTLRKQFRDCDIRIVAHPDLAIVIGSAIYGAVRAQENDVNGENLLRALAVAASPGASASDKAVLTQKWRLYHLNYLKESAKLDALSDDDVKSFGLLYVGLDVKEIAKIDKLLEYGVHKCDGSLKKQTEFPGFEPTSVEYLDKLLRKCEDVKPEYDVLLQRIACQQLNPGLKDPKRIIDKARFCYRDNYCCVLDIIRGSFICNNVRDMLRVVKSFLDAADEGYPRTWQVVRYKNRFVMGDASNSRGYRDLNMNVRHIRTGIVTEVQFHLQSFFEYDKKARGHKKYEFVR